MRYRHLFWVIVGWFFVLGNGKIEHVSGMPMHLFGVGGSRLCDSHFQRPTMEQPRWRVSYEIVFGDKSSFVANNASCDLEIWTDRTKIGQEAKTRWREVDLTRPIISQELRKLEAHLETENPELHKIYIHEGNRVNFLPSVNFIAKISCRKRKVKDCIHFLYGRGASHIQRRPLSVDEVYLHREPKDDLPFQPIIFVVAGVVILVMAGSLCSACTQDKEDDESVSGTRPELMSVTERTSVHRRAEQQQSSQEKVGVAVKDNVAVETVATTDVDTVDGNYSSVYDEPTVVRRPSSVEKVDHNGAENRGNDSSMYDEPTVVRKPSSVEKVDHVGAENRGNDSSLYDEPTVVRKPSSVERVDHIGAKNRDDHAPKSVEHVQKVQHVSISEDHLTEDDHKNGDKKRERGHEEHKGKFWKRSRGSKYGHKTSDGVVKDDEKKHNRRSRKESKEQKAKSGKTKDSKGSVENGEKKVQNEHHGETPKEAISSLERHARGLPAPPPPPPHPPFHSPPVHPMPLRQCSDPGENWVADGNYETVDVRKAKSQEILEFSREDNYDTVQVEGKKIRSPTSFYQSVKGQEERWSITDSDIYEIVKDTKTSVKDGLSTKVTGNEEENSLKKLQLCIEVEEDENQGVEDPYSKIKKLISTETETNEEVQNLQQQGDAKGLIDSDFRNRSKSDTSFLKKSGNDFFVFRSNTFNGVRTRGDNVSPSIEALYAKVDLSKKTTRSSGDENETAEEPWSDANPPPLPPVYISSQQIKIEMHQVKEDANGLYDEVVQGTTEQQHPSNEESSVLDAETKRQSVVSNQYELVEVKHNISPMEGNYSGLSNEGPKPTTIGNSGVVTEHKETKTPVPSLNENVDDEEAHYELVSPPKKSSNSRNAVWI